MAFRMFPRSQASQRQELDSSAEIIDDTPEQRLVSWWNCRHGLTSSTPSF